MVRAVAMEHDGNSESEHRMKQLQIGNMLLPFQQVIRIILEM